MPRSCPVISPSCLLAAVSVLFFSCMGVSSGITLNSDGSGVITLEYCIAAELENMGRLDGNEQQLPVPLGRNDLERSIARIPGLALVSYTSDQKGKNTIHTAKLSFSSPEALAAFYDSSGRLFSIDFPNKKIAVHFPEAGKTDPAFRELAGNALQEYDFSFSMTIPGQVQAAWLDGNGKIVQQFPGTCNISGSKIEYIVSMAELVLLDVPLTLEINW